MQDNHTRRAAVIGRSHGTGAAQWVFDGNTPDETYRRVLAGIEECDAEILDGYRSPDLSGEYTADDLASDLGLDSQSDTSVGGLDAARSAYLEAAAGAFWDEVERAARAHAESGKIAALQAAGYEITYVDRGDVTPDGKVLPYTYYHHARPAPGLAAYADLSPAGRDDYGHGLVTTTDRSNYRSLVRDHPGAFTPVDHADNDGLGAFVADLTDDLVAILAALPDHPVYDEGDLSKLESDEIATTWDQYVSGDITSELHAADEAAGGRWDALTRARQRDMFWQVVGALDIYPEHDGREVHWSGHYPVIVAELTRRLTPSAAGECDAG